MNKLCCNKDVDYFFPQSSNHSVCIKWHTLIKFGYW
jgi:hypothetical protein